MSTDNIDEHKTNEDPNKDGDEEGLITDLDFITNKKKGNSEINIQVCNPSVREEKFSKYTVYTVKGSDKDGNFEVVRRYRDFDKIRALLVSRWPGCNIPPLPPKNNKPMNNMEGKFVEERRRSLNTFCQKIGDLPYLHYSEEYQIFIRSGSSDLEKRSKTFAPLAKFTHEDLITKYTNNFSTLAGKELSVDLSIKIAAFKAFLQKTHGQFESYKKIAKGVSQARRAYYEQFSIFHNQVCMEYEKNIFTEYHGNTKGMNVFSDVNSTTLTDHADKLKQASGQPSLEYLYEWLNIECREIEAFLEAISQRDKYEAMRNKAQDKQKSDLAELTKVQAGKTTLKTFFSRKSKGEEVSDLEKNIEQGAKDVVSLSKLHDMMTLIIAYHEIDRFKSKKVDQYYYVVKLAAQSEFNNTHHIVDYWNVVAENQNVTKYVKA